MAINCIHNDCNIAIIIASIYAGFLILVCLVLACLTRKVEVPALNEYKELSTVIYLTAIFLMEFAIISTFIIRFNSLQEGLANGHLSLMSWLSLSILFIPKVSVYFKIVFSFVS